MSVLLDTDGVEAEHRAALWRDAHPRFFFPLTVQIGTTELFSGRIRAHRIGPLQLFRVESDPSVVRRSRTSIARSDPEWLNVGLLLGGRCLVEQSGRQALMLPGDLSSWDTSEPFTIRSAEPVDLLMTFVPRALLGAHAEEMRHRTAQRTAGTTGVGALAAPFLTGLWHELDDEVTRLPHGDLAESALGLVRALHAGPPKVPGAALVPRMKRYVDDHLSDPDLGPESVARAHYVSVRYVHKLFTAEPVSLSRWILQRRLERIRRDLLDPGLSHVTISTIMRWWGLPNTSHATQLFRRHYGCTPREMRDAARRRTG